MRVSECPSKFWKHCFATGNQPAAILWKDVSDYPACFTLAEAEEILLATHDGGQVFDHWRGIQGDSGQLGGDFIVDANGVIQLAYRSYDPTDRPPMSELLNVLAHCSTTNRRVETGWPACPAAGSRDPPHWIGTPR